MADLADHSMDWLLPGIIVAFLVLYITGIRSGLEPEFALLQAGGAGAALAIIGRLAVAVVSVKRETAEPIDVTVDPLMADMVGQDSVQGETTESTETALNAEEQEQQAVGV